MTDFELIALMAASIYSGHVNGLSSTPTLAIAEAERLHAKLKEDWKARSKTREAQ